jgi:hypothetical protein
MDPGVTAVPGNSELEGSEVTVCAMETLSSTSNLKAVGSNHETFALPSL